MAKTEDALSVERGSQHKGLQVRRRFTTEGTHPYDELTWEHRDAVITNWRDGTTAFEQRDVEFPTTWSLNATNIVAQKYFRGPLGTPRRERSVRQMIDRVAGTISGWGAKDGYFATDADAEVFQAELTHVLVNQMAAFNSPVWFNVGVEPDPQCSACQPYDALVSTPTGMVPIGELVERKAVGTVVYDAHGETRVRAVKYSGEKQVFRVRLRNGSFIEATGDHLVYAVQERRTEGAWLRVDQLKPGMRLHMYPHRASQDDVVGALSAESTQVLELGGGTTTAVRTDLGTSKEVSEAALAGWLQADGFVGQYSGTNKSLTIEFVTVTQEEYDWVQHHLATVFPQVHQHVRTIELDDPTLVGRRVRLYGNVLQPFVDAWELRPRRHALRVPSRLWIASNEVVAAYLRSVFQSDGLISQRGETVARIGLGVISEQWTEDLQILLLRLGIYSRRLKKVDPRPDRSDLWELMIGMRSERRAFADKVGFISAAKAAKLATSLEFDGKSCPDLREETIVAIEDRGTQPVYDIQTDSGEYLSNNVRVHNCFILSVEDTMPSILNWYVEEGMIFKGGSGSGINLSSIRSSREQLANGGEASGPVSFMRGADASAGTIKSGGKTRRAAKMVILNVDHPDVRDFIWCKAREEHKARALRDAGFDMDLDGRDAYSIQYQNANNSVRVTDEFMAAYQDGRDYELRAVTDGSVTERAPARDVMREIAQAAWECADPGMQYDTTINDWHTTPESGRINASNPCFTGDMRVHTDKGLIRFDDLLARAAEGETFGIYTHDATNPDAPAETVTLSSHEAVMVTGTNAVVRLCFSHGAEIRCTPNHRFWTANRGWVRADELEPDDQVRLLDHETPAGAAERRLPVSTDVATYATKGDHAAAMALPDKWDEDFAHLLGWLVGDGSFSGDVVSAIYGSAEDRAAILPRHLELFTALNDGRAPKVSEQANGTAQLRLSRRALAGFFQALGLKPVKAADKDVPWSVFEAPTEAVTAFLRGLFDADGTVVDQAANATRYVGLGSRSPRLLRSVQALLASLGIGSRIYANGSGGPSGFTYTARDGAVRTYESAPGHDLRITGDGIDRFAALIGFDLPSKAARLERAAAAGKYRKARTATLVSREDDGFEVTYNLTEPKNHSYIVEGIVVSNCSEYMHLDNSACNLASLNLLKFLRPDGTFDVEAYKHAVEIVFLAQEIIVGNSSYPTEPITANAKAFRQLGLGYANLGALLMALGKGYDSDGGRAWAGALTALMTGHAYRTSARIAEVTGPFAGYAPNREPMLRVMRKHRAAVDDIDANLVQTSLLSAARTAWDEAIDFGEEFGYRNAQASVLAPTGTISFLMDCDTTGIEPDLALIKYKKLVGGGSMAIVNQTVPRALRTLGYAEEQVEAIVEYVAEHNSVKGAPALREEHYEVFECAMGDLPIHHMGHLRMMAAAQPFLSGAISKCVTGDTLVPTTDGMIRIGCLHDGEPADTFRDEILGVVSTDGIQKTDAFYYGGVRPVREIVLRSGHRITGTPNHRLLVGADEGLQWRYLAEIQPGDSVAQRYGADLWATLPPSFADFAPTRPYGSQKPVTIPKELTQELAFLLGAYAAEGHTNRSKSTIIITNSVDAVLERVAAAWASQFGIEGKIVRQPGKCPAVVATSKTVVEFLDYLGCGTRASNKRIPDAVLRSPRSTVLSFLQGLALDAYVSTSSMAKWAICLDAPALLDDLQAILTNLGIVHGRVSKHDSKYDKFFDEVYATGDQAQQIVELVPFLEPDKAARAAKLRSMAFHQSTADVVPGITGRALYELLPRGKSGRNGYGVRAQFAYLLDSRTHHVSRRTLDRVAAVAGVELPDWLRMIVRDNLRFSPVASVTDVGEREVFDLSVPVTRAFVGNGILNHNTVNLPEQVTVEDVEQVFVEGWRLGLKAVAIYRDNCKVGQPLSADKSDKKAAGDGKDVVHTDTGVDIQIEQAPVRRRLPKSRPATTTSFRIADLEGYVTAGSYPDDGLGEIFVKVSKQGSTLSGVMDAFAIAVSLGLQYGVPLEAFVSKFTNTIFEPNGLTDDPDIRFAQSIVDYLFRRLAIDHLDEETRVALGIRTTAERTAALNGETQAPAPAQATPIPAPAPAPEPVKRPTSSPSGSALSLTAGMASVDAPYCSTCGVKMRPAGSCFACESCGTTSGCS